MRIELNGYVITKQGELYKVAGNSAILFTTELIDAVAFAKR